jgi:hypothetical protein
MSLLIESLLIGHVRKVNQYIANNEQILNKVQGLGLTEEEQDFIAYYIFRSGMASNWPIGGPMWKEIVV